MKCTDFFIKRPIFAISLSLLVVLAGLFAFSQLSLRLFPKIDVPVVTVTINYPGADATTMQDFVTNVVENAITGVQGINYITSSSCESSSQIQVYMKMGTDADIALMNIMQQVSAIRGQLPKDIDEPIISKTNADDNPTLLLAFTSEDMTEPQVTDYLTRVVKPQIETVDGVDTAQVMGNQYAMRLWLDPDKLAAYNVSTGDVISALQQQNIQSSPGAINNGGTNFNITTNASLKTAEQFNNIIIKNINNRIIKLIDIGQATLGSETYKINAFYNGKPAIMVFIKSQSGANPLTVVKAIKKILPEIEQRLPGDMALHEVVNSATYINASINEVLWTLAEGILIVSLVIFMFIGNYRAVLIPAIAIPIALIGICFFLLVLGYSINLLVLLAMVLAVGLVVDDAIVVMENIVRHLEKGLSVLDAALVGAGEIAFSIVAMSLTLAAIFAPIFLTGGVSGKLFSEFAFSLAGMAIISGFVALTLSPMMCSKILSGNFSQQHLVAKVESGFSLVRTKYSELLGLAWRHKKLLVGVWFVSILVCLYFYASTPKELSPKEDVGFMQVLGSAPDSATSEFLMQNTKLFNNVYAKFPEIESYIYINGIPSDHQVLSFVRLKPWGKRTLTANQLQPQLQSALNQMPALQTVAINPDVLPGSQGFPVEFVIKSIGDYKDLYNVAETIMRQARTSGLFGFVNDDLNYDQPILNMQIDREAATALNVSIDSITGALTTMLSENKIQYFSLAGQTYQVIPEANSQSRLDPVLLNNIHVKTNSGNLIPLASVVTMQTTIEPAALNQFQKFNSVTISGVMAPNVSLSTGLKFLAKQATKAMTHGMSFDYSGNSRQFIQEGNRMLWIFLAAFLIIFLVLAMQFESFKDPLIILFGSVPMSLMAAMIPLKLGFATINIYTQIGLLTLVGLISKHGILMTKFANVLRGEGYDKWEAIIKAAEIRLRPILMTTFAIVFGALPLIFARGAGSVSRFDIGIVIAIGMLLGTVFTLFVLPVLYYYFASKRV